MDAPNRTFRISAGRWGPPQTVPCDGLYLTLAWADQGTALIGIDSSWRAVVQPVAGGAARQLTLSDIWVATVKGLAQ